MHHLTRKISTIFLVVAILFSFALTGCVDLSEFDDTNTATVDDTEDRTYHGVLYDVAYGADVKDGLRSKACFRYLFSTAENKAVKCVHLTMGDGKTTVYEGTFEGSLDDKVTITYIRNGQEETETLIRDGACLKREDGKYTFSQNDVKSTITRIKAWK